MMMAFRLVRVFMIGRMRAQRNLRYINLATSVLVIAMMFVFTQSRIGEYAPTPGVVEYSAWRVLLGLVITVLATALAEVGSRPEQEFLMTLGLSARSYLWAKWFDLGARCLPWLLWGVSWGVSMATSVPGRPYVMMSLYAVYLFVYALTVGGLLGFLLESSFRRLAQGQQASKTMAMVAPFALVGVMMGLGSSAPVPPILHAISSATPIRYFHSALYSSVFSHSSVWDATLTLVPGIVGLGLLSLVWSFGRDGMSNWKARRLVRQDRTVSFRRYPFIAKDLLMLRRYGFTIFRGVITAGVLVVPFMFMNTQTDLPLFIRFFEVMIIVAASGMLFGLVLPAMDREVLWLIRLTGQLRPFVLHKFCLVSLMTLVISSVVVAPVSFTLNLPLVAVALLVLVGSFAITSLSLIAGALAVRMGVDMMVRPDSNLVMGVMLGFGLFLSTVVLAWAISLTVFIGFLLLWTLISLAGVGVTGYLLQTQDL